MTTTVVNAKRSAVSSSIYATRRFARRKADVRVRLLARERMDRPATVIYARTIDLSRGGACVMLSRELALGTEVLLCLRLPGCSLPFCLQAVVIRRRGFRAGLKFLQPTAQQRWLLGELWDA